MGFDYVSDAEGVDVVFEAAAEGAGCFFAADFGEGVAGNEVSEYNIYDQKRRKEGDIRIFRINIIIFF